MSITLYFTLEHKHCHAECSLILKSSISTILFPPSSAEENLRNSRSLSSEGLYNIRGGKMEKTQRKTDFENTGKFLARKISSEFCGKWGIRMECTVGII